MPHIDAPSSDRIAAPILTEPPVRLQRPAMFLDMDGVLAPIAATPDAVHADPRRTAILRELSSRLEGRVAILSGRTIDEIDRLTERSLDFVSGVHGLERRLAEGRLVRAEPSPALATVVETFRRFAADRPGVIVEDKAIAAGLHYRTAPDQAGAVIELTRRLADETGLSLQAGDMIAELKTPGSTKGVALHAFMSEAPFSGGVPVMVGDDLTDEYAFEAAAELGGFGVLVGPPRPTAARHRLDDVAAVLDWLETIETDV